MNRHPERSRGTFTGTPVIMELCVYILASFRRTLYVGVTNDLVRRLTQHRDASTSKFTGKYRVHRLVYCESAGSPMDAIEREKQIKGWRRSKKIALIQSFNPGWRDLSQDILGTAPTHAEMHNQAGFDVGRASMPDADY